MVGITRGKVIFGSPVSRTHTHRYEPSEWFLFVKVSMYAQGMLQSFFWRSRLSLRRVRLTGQKINRFLFNNLTMSKYMGCDICQAGSVGKCEFKNHWIVGVRVVWRRYFQRWLCCVRSHPYSKGLNAIELKSIPWPMKTKLFERFCRAWALLKFRCLHENASPESTFLACIH